MGETYNATTDLLERNLAHPDRPAFRQDGRVTTYGALCERANRAGNALRALGVQVEQRVLLCMLDTPDLPAVFWGAMKAGLVPVPVNTLLTTADYDYLLRDSRARVLVVSAPLLPKLEPALREQPFLQSVVAAGASSVLLADRPTPQSVVALLQKEKPTFFFGVPTLFAGMLADSTATDLGGRLRWCVSAGEPLPRDIGLRWRERYGVDILDGIGSTELLHIFLSLRPGDVRYGTTGKPVPGYEIQIVDEQDRPVAPGEIGELRVSGPSSAVAYWNNREKSLRAFRGRWTYTGDKYLQDADGYYVYCGRSDDMFKAGGQWVSPAEVESALIAHPSVLEAAVVAHKDEN